MSFLKKGKRAEKRLERRRTKKHMKAFYSIMGEVKQLAQTIHDSGVEWSEENIVEVAADFTELKIADMEKFLLLGNLSLLRDEAKSNNTEER